MKISFYINSAGHIDQLNTFINRDHNYKHQYDLWDQIDEIYVSSRIIFEILKKEELENNESSRLGKIYDFNKPVSIIPQSYLMHSDIEDSGEIELYNENSQTSQKFNKWDYIYHFYNEISEDPLMFEFDDNTFSKYCELNSYFKRKINEIRVRGQESTLLPFFDQAIPKTLENKKIAPYFYIERVLSDYSINFKTLFEKYPNLWDNYDTFLLYMNYENFINIDKFEHLHKLSNFKNIILWIPDFKEFYASKEKIRWFRDGLEKLNIENQNIIYLYGGLLNHHFFEKYIKEIIFKTDLYPSYSVIPHNPIKFNKKNKRIFFPYFGRVTSPKNILDGQYRNLFNCDCHTCSNFNQKGQLDVEKAIDKIENSNRMNLYHNIYSFLKKIKSGEPIEIDPEISFEKRKLFKTWSDALND